MADAAKGSVKLTNQLGIEIPQTISTESGVVHTKTTINDTGFIILNADTLEQIGGLIARGAQVYLLASALADPRVASNYATRIFTEDDTVQGEPIDRFGLIFVNGEDEYGVIGLERNEADSSLYKTFCIGRKNTRTVISTKKDLENVSYSALSLGSRTSLAWGNLRSTYRETDGSQKYAGISTNAYNEAVELEGHLLPEEDNTYDCGSADLRIRKYYGASSTISTSDEREKHDIEPLDEALADRFLMALDPILFRLNALPKELRCGFGAKAFRKAMLDAGIPDDYAGYDGENPEHLGLCYEQLIGMLVSGYQRQQRKINSLEERIKKVEGRLP